jgi:hypothetical protein
MGRSRRSEDATVSKPKPRYTFGPVELNEEGERFLEELRDLHNPGGMRMVIRYNGKQSGAAVGFVRRADADAFRVYFEPNRDEQARARAFAAKLYVEQRERQEELDKSEDAKLRIRRALASAVEELEEKRSDLETAHQELEKSAEAEGEARALALEASSSGEHWFSKYGELIATHDATVRERGWFRRMAVWGWVVGCFAIAGHIARVLVGSW